MRTQQTKTKSLPKNTSKDISNTIVRDPLLTPRNLSLAQKYAQLDAAKKKLTKQMDGIREEFILACAEEERSQAQIGEVIVTYSMRTGTVDLNRLEAELNIDLNEYRKPPTSVWTLKVGVV